MHVKEFELYFKRAKLLLSRSYEELVSEARPVAAEFAVSSRPVQFSDRLELEYQPAAEGLRWGEPWDSAWFHLSGRIPKEWRGRAVALRLNFSGEALVFGGDGVPKYGLTSGSVLAENYTKEFYLLSDRAEGGESFELWIEAAANSLFGLEMEGDPGRNCPTPYGHYLPCVHFMRLGLFDTELWHFRLDLEVLISMIEALGAGDYRSARILDAINRAAGVYAGNPANAAAARAILAPALALPAQASAMTATAVGHAHIDTGWLWPVRETVRKCARTFASQLGLLERYPDYVFGASQAQLYAFTRDHYPELFAEIKKRVAEGRWEIQGGMWVEADCNLISGESMVRQFLHGKNFFMDEFGFEVKNLWIPDVFGYAASMPQIIRKAGCDYFLTQKISWSQFNRFPYNTFYWKGIDGTRVLTHFPPEDNYNANLLPAEMAAAQNRMSENGFQDEFLSLFGIGNGGGGPKEEHIEHGLRLASLEGNPKVKFGRADDFFRSIEAKFGGRLPEWVGELYLEFHRGTLTTQGRTKRGNRKLEQLLAQVEFIGACLQPEAYPQATLDLVWKTLLINQFHDIIPGSSITMVYATAEKQYAEATVCLNELAGEMAARVLEEDPASMTLVNSLSCVYRGAVELPESWNGCRVVDADGKAVPVQSEGNRSWALAALPESSWTTLRRGRKAKAADASVGGHGNLVLENELVRYQFAADGRLVKAFDKEFDREILAGDGNVFSFYNDHPNNYDAWDIDLFYEDELIAACKASKARKVVDGPVRSVLEFEYAIGDSELTQQVVLTAGGKRLDFHTAVEWHEMRKMLRVAFPAKVFADEAVFDIQYGYVRRPTHRNTSWDLAKFEVAGQRYADLSEPGYGVALLNDCKYGYKVRGTTLDLCLLRSPKFPDWDADQGAHFFTYSLYPHEGVLAESGVYDEAACLNRPPMVFAGYAGGVEAPCRVEGDRIRLEVVKKAEKSDDIVIRLVEIAGARSVGRLVLNDKFKVVPTDLLEWRDGKAEKVAGAAVALTLEPFEIRTYKLKK